MKKVILFLVFIIFLPSVLAEVDRSCLNNSDINFEKYPKSILVDFKLINNGDPSFEYSHIGGYFSYIITYTNVGKENLFETLDVNIISPAGEYPGGHDRINIDLNVGDKNSFNPLHTNENEVKVFEFVNLGTHKIVLKGKEIDFFRCLGNSYVHYKGEITYAFDPMPNWQKDVAITQKNILNSINSIREDVQNFLSPTNQIIGMLIAIGVPIILSIRKIRNAIYKFLKNIISLIGFVYGLLLIGLGMGVLIENRDIYWNIFGLFLLVSGIYFLNILIPEIRLLTILKQKIKEKISSWRKK